MIGVPESTAEEVGRRLNERVEKLRKALLPLERDGGPKLEDRYLLLVGLTQDLTFDKKPEATKALKSLGASITHLKAVTLALERLPKSVQLRMEMLSRVTIPTHYDDGETRMLEPLKEHRSLGGMLGAILDEFEREHSRVEAEKNAYGARRGSPPVIAARLIALQVAEIFQYLRPGEPLTCSTNDGSPSSPFARAVHAVFKVEGVGISFRSPCDHAIKIFEMKR